MDETMVAQVRRFNRIVTQRVGALQDHFHGRARPLGEARLLWEIGAGGPGRTGGREVRRLRADLGFDSGYLSRLLRSLQEAGLVTVDASEEDGRVRTARLTRAGVSERARLDERSDQVADQLLEPLTPVQRDRLVAAMAEVERLLRAGSIVLTEVDPAHPDAQHCLQSYFSELDLRFEHGFDLAHQPPAVDEQLRRPSGLLLVAYLGREPLGCGALRRHSSQVGELKRIWVAPAARGLGLGRRLLDALEQRALEQGIRVVQLDTNGALTEAITLYESAGYRAIAPYNDNPYAQHWFEKRLQ